MVIIMCAIAGGSQLSFMIFDNCTISWAVWIS
jgi:hypothetical protein